MSDTFRALLEEAVEGFSRILVGTSDQERVYDWVDRCKKALRSTLLAEPYFRVERDGQPLCEHCGKGGMWTVVYGPAGDETQIGTSWEDRDLVGDICDLMNAAFIQGRDLKEKEHE